MTDIWSPVLTSLISIILTTFTVLIFSPLMQKNNFFSFILCVLLSSLSLSAQNVNYQIQIDFDSLHQSMHVETEILLTNSDSNLQDSLWFHLPFYAYSHKYNAFDNSMLRQNMTSYHFRSEKLLAEVSDFKVSSHGQPVHYLEKGHDPEFISLATPNGKIVFSYTIRLPKAINGFGIEDGNIFIRHFYPIPIIHNNLQDFQPLQKGKNIVAPVSNFRVKINHTGTFRVLFNGPITAENGQLGINRVRADELIIALIKPEVPVTKQHIISNTRKITYHVIHLDTTFIQNWADAGMWNQNIVDASIDLVGDFPYDAFLWVVNSDGDNCYVSDGMVSTDNFTKKNKSRKDVYFSKNLMDLWINGNFKNIDPAYSNIHQSISQYFANKAQGIVTQYIYRDMKSDAHPKFDNNSPLVQSIQKHSIKPIDTPDKDLTATQLQLKYHYQFPAYLEYMSQLTSRPAMETAIWMIREQNSQLNPTTLAENLAKTSGKDIINSLSVYASANDKLDYKINKVRKDGVNTIITASNNGKIKLPSQLTVKKKNGEVSRYLIDGFVGEQTLTLDSLTYESVERVSIDWDGVLPDGRRGNNHYFPHSLLKRGPLALTSILGSDYSDRSEIKWGLFPAFNDNDRWMIGGLLTNRGLLDYKPWTVTIIPMYSFQTGKIVGQAWTEYDHYFNDSNIKKLHLHAGVKSFDMNQNDFYQYTERYLKTDIGIRLTFAEMDTDKKNSALTLRGIYILEDRPNYDPKEGTYLGLSPLDKKKFIQQIIYDWEKASVLNGTTIRFVAEHQAYRSNQRYLKLSGTLVKRWMFKKDKNIYLRAFVGGFPMNTQSQSSSYQNDFVRGSIALIHQGFNDYTYDEYFFSRKNQNGFYDDQVSLTAGGGFKTPIGSAYSIGMSNRFAAALNGIVDLPFSTRWFPLQLYFDVGTYTTWSNGKFGNNVMYNGGLMLNFADVVRIHFPIIFSEELGNRYKEVHHGFLSRLSFAFDLHKLNFNHSRFYKSFKI